MMNIKAGLTLISVLFFLAGCTSTTSTNSAPVETSQSTNSKALSFVVFGDHGYIVPGKPKRSGMKPVASSIAEYCDENRCDFALMLGDNIYPKGASGSSDDAKLFQDHLVEPYGKLGEDDPEFRIYATLGNHDWQTSREGAEAELAFFERTRPFHMDGFAYSAKPPVADGNIEIFVIDTTILLATEQLAKVNVDADGRFSVDRSNLKRGGPKRALPRADAEKNQIENLARQLEQSTAKWKFVVAHHPLWESGGEKANQALRMRELLLPILCDNADAYFAGHQHTLEVHSYDCPGEPRDAKQAPLLHVISGAAAKTRDIDDKVVAAIEAEDGVDHIWAAGDAYGYFVVDIEGDTLEIHAIMAPDGTLDSSEFRKAHKSIYLDRH